MQELVLKTSAEGSVLVTAAEHGDIGLLRAVVTWFNEHLTSEQVRVNLSFRIIGFPTSKVMWRAEWSLFLTRAKIGHRRTASIVIIRITYWPTHSRLSWFLQ